MRLWTVTLFAVGLLTAFNSTGAAGVEPQKPDAASLRKIRQLYQLACQQRARNHVRESIDTCSRILAIDPRNSAALSLRGRDEVMLDLCPQGLADCKLALKYESGDMSIYVGAAEAYMCLRRAADAADILTLGMKTVPPKQVDDEIYRMRGETYELLGKHDLAIADLTKAQKIKPEKPDNWSARSNIYFAMGEYDKAVADVTNAIKIAPGNLRLYGARAQIYRKMGKIDLAKRDEVKAKTGDLDF